MFDLKLTQGQMLQLSQSQCQSQCLREFGMQSCCIVIGCCVVLPKMLIDTFTGTLKHHGEVTSEELYIVREACGHL